MNNKVYLALYKGRKTGRTPSALIARFSDWLTKKLTRGPYSHCEIAVKVTKFESGHHYEHETQYQCYSSSIRDGGVRTKIIDIRDGKWDIVPLPNLSPNTILTYFTHTQGKKYDWLGALGIVLLFKHRANRYFCSEWCFNAIAQTEQGWRFSPNDLAVLLK